MRPMPGPHGEARAGSDVTSGSEAAPSHGFVSVAVRGIARSSATIAVGADRMRRRIGRNLAPEAASESKPAPIQ